MRAPAMASAAVGDAGDVGEFSALNRNDIMGNCKDGLGLLTSFCCRQ